MRYRLSGGSDSGGSSGAGPLISETEGDMAMVRTVIVGVRGANNKLETHRTSIPADWVDGNKDALKELYDNDQLRTKISVAPGAAVFCEIGEPHDPSAGLTIRRG